jgi:4-carboxymuconolactone decarboxylase
MLVLLAWASTETQMIITRGGSRAVRPGPAANFTGEVRVEMLFEAIDPAPASGSSVTFEPGARAAWHTHPQGQILIITASIGRVQRWGDPIEEVRAGDVVRVPAGQKHWHGASPQVSMTRFAITEHRDGTAVQWMEKVTPSNTNPSTFERYNIAGAGVVREAAGWPDAFTPYRDSTLRLSGNQKTTLH